MTPARVEALERASARAASRPGPGPWPRYTPAVLNLDPAKLVVILLLALVVLGPERLPRAARQMAGVWRELVRIRDQVSAEMRDAIPDLELPKIPSTKGAITSLIGSVRGPSSATARAGTAANLPSSAAGAGERTPPLIVVHPGFEDVAFLPDDPSMN